MLKDLISGTGFILCMIGAGGLDGYTNFNQSIWPPVVMMAAGAGMIFYTERREKKKMIEGYEKGSATAPTKAQAEPRKGMKHYMLPECSCCGEHIQDEYAYCINGEWMCDSCMDRNYRKEVPEW